MKQYVKIPMSSPSRQRQTKVGPEKFAFSVSMRIETTEIEIVEKCRKSQISTAPCIYRPSNFVAAVTPNKSCPHQKWKEFDDNCIPFDAIAECDGQTDRRTDFPIQYRALHA